MYFILLLGINSIDIKLQPSISSLLISLWLWSMPGVTGHWSVVSSGLVIAAPFVIIPDYRRKSQDRHVMSHPGHW